MRKSDVLAAFVVGEACALIFLLILRFLELPALIVKLAKFFPFVLPVLSISGTYVVSLFEKRSPTTFQMGKSFLVGILNTFIDLGILNFLMALFNVTSGWLYSVFVAFSFSCATINSYFWNKFWAFEKKKTEKTTKEFLQFSLVTLGGLLIHISVSSLIVNIIGTQWGLSEKVWANFGKIIAVFCGFLWNFLGYKFVVFKK